MTRYQYKRLVSNPSGTIDAKFIRGDYQLRLVIEGGSVSLEQDDIKRLIAYLKRLEAEHDDPK